MTSLVCSRYQVYELQSSEDFSPRWNDQPGIRKSLPSWSEWVWSQHLLWFDKSTPKLWRSPLRIHDCLLFLFHPLLLSLLPLLQLDFANIASLFRRESSTALWRFRADFESRKAIASSGISQGSPISRDNPLYLLSVLTLPLLKTTHSCF